MAIVRDIPESFTECLTIADHPALIDVKKAKEQHSIYCRTLSELGLKIETIKADERLPDCCFTEDTAVVLDEIAIITRPGMPERMLETIEIENSLRAFRKISRIIAPAHLEGGDVVVIDKNIFIGSLPEPILMAFIRYKRLFILMAIK